MTNTSRPLTIIESNCDADLAYNLTYAIEDSSRTKRVGHILKLSFPYANKSLMPDTLVYNPIQTAKQESIVGVIEYIQWAGGSMDPVLFEGMISFKNRAIMRESLFMNAQKDVMAIEFVIYDYDYDKKTYFKSFYTCHTTEFLITRARISDTDNRVIKRPLNFICNFSLEPISEIKNQKLGVAFSADGEHLTREIGKMLTAEGESIIEKNRSNQQAQL